ncbi:hypothetical protein B0T19DRAFT_147722 [Cercophora scortea]|uniref:Uncharacterized protein n=1 Tax=Cercophora scortea TaxID=314031 RepID=A0AAE0MJ71_9PEZI|nr:hypothetical protein B0T19DRAFT_147722 [Cercophora scortea]
MSVDSRGTMLRVDGSAPPSPSFPPPLFRDIQGRHPPQVLVHDIAALSRNDASKHVPFHTARRNISQQRADFVLCSSPHPMSMTVATATASATRTAAITTRLQPRRRRQRKNPTRRNAARSAQVAAPLLHYTATASLTVACSITLRTEVHPSSPADAVNDPRSKYARAKATTMARIGKMETRAVYTSIQNGLGRAVDPTQTLFRVRRLPPPSPAASLLAGTNTRKHTHKRPDVYRRPYVRSPFVLRSSESQLARSCTTSSRYTDPPNMPGKDMNDPSHRWRSPPCPAEDPISPVAQP